MTTPHLKLADSQLEIKEFLKDVTKKVTDLQSTFNTFGTFVIGALTLGFIVLIFSLATILMQAWQFSATYQDESHQLQVEKDAITQSIQNQQVIINNQKDIKSELDWIKSQLPTPTP